MVVECLKSSKAGFFSTCLTDGHPDEIGIL